MHNILLDGFPNEYRGYKINTDFRIGITISLIMEDSEFPEELRLEKCFGLLYVNNNIPFDIAYNGLIWFLSCGRSEMIPIDFGKDDNDKNKAVKDIAFDFQYDALQIWGGFWSRGIDLEKCNMHWFKFITALQNLHRPVIDSLMENRTIDLEGMTGKTRAAYVKLKNKVRVRKVVCGEDAERYLEEKAEIEKQVREEEEKNMTNYERRYMEALNNAKK